MYSVKELERGEKNFAFTHELFLSVVKSVESLNSRLIGKNIRVYSGFRPDDLNGDHKEGRAIDIDADDVASLFWFWATIVKNWNFFQSKGINKCFLLLHARGVHLSFKPEDQVIRGYEDYNGGNRKDAGSYPIPRFTGSFTNAEQILLLNKAVKLYGISLSETTDYFGSDNNDTGGCLSVISFFLFLFGFAEFGVHYLNF